MDNRDFKEKFVEDVRRELFYQKGRRDVEIAIEQVDKLNESYEAMAVHLEGSKMGVNLHFEDYIQAYEDGVAYQDVVERAVTDIEKHIDNIPEFDITFISDYKLAKERLSIEVVSAERNANVLETVPHKLIEDMAIIYKINVELGIEDGGTVLVNDSLLKMYGISQDQLHEDAVKNASIIKPFLIRGMSKILQDMMSEEEAAFFGVEDAQDEAMYVATVPGCVKGAGVLAYDKFMDYAVEKLGGDFFVLPSSVHEILLVKDDGKTSYEELKEMVEQVNEAEVKPEEKLTDSVYHYDSKNRIFELGDKFEARRNQELAAAKNEKGSVLNDLREKQAAAAEKSVIPKDVEKAVSKTQGGVAI